MKYSESDTRANYIDPQLKNNNWEAHNIKREYYFTDGRKALGNKRGDRKFADYLLKYKGCNLAIIEAKREGLSPTEGLEQVKDYGKILNLRFVYSSNGKETYEFDLLTGEIVFKNGNIYNKVRFDGIAKKPYISLIDNISGQTGQKNLDDLFNYRAFDHPKPEILIKKLLTIVSSKNSIVLDFMAGSGTTGHAVLDLNKEDGGNRKFILCTNNENKICEEVTYERIKRVSNGYTNSKGKEIEGLGGNLRYYKTDFVEIENLKEITDKKKLELTYNAGELLAIKEGIYNELEKNNFWQIFGSEKDIVAIYFKESARKVDEMKERLKEIQKEKGGKVKWYIYNNPYEKTMFKDIKKLELKDIPDPILKVYREINKV